MLRGWRVSPWARPGFTDSNLATPASMPSLVEHDFGLQPLWVGERHWIHFHPDEHGDAT